MGTTHIGSGAHTRGGAQDVEGAHTGSDGGVRPAQSTDKDIVGQRPTQRHGTEVEGVRELEPLSDSHLIH